MKFLIILVTVLLLGTTGTTAQSRGRLYNARMIDEYEQPYLVRLLIVFPNSNEAKTCSGSLIDRRWVLTAAHCVLDRTMLPEFVVIFTGQSTADPKRFHAVVAGTTQNIITHEEYNNTEIINDIALIRIPRIRLSSKVNVIAISSNESCVNERVTVAGWGASSPNGISGIHAQSHDFTVMNNTYCTQVSGWQLLESQLCLYEPNVAACEGDSGGPAKLGDRLTGVGSFVSARGCDQNVPMVYTKVSFFNEWIRRHANLTR